MRRILTRYFDDWLVAGGGQVASGRARLKRTVGPLIDGQTIIFTVVIMGILDPTEQYNYFNHATIDHIHVGPRRAITLILSPLLWEGNRGYYGSPKRVRLGGIERFDTVKQLFAQLPDLELARLSLHQQRLSTQNKRYVIIAFERSELEYEIECQHFTVEDMEEETELYSTSEH